MATAHEVTTRAGYNALRLSCSKSRLNCQTFSYVYNCTALRVFRKTKCLPDWSSHSLETRAAPSIEKQKQHNVKVECVYTQYLYKWPRASGTACLFNRGNIFSRRFNRSSRTRHGDVNHVTGSRFNIVAMMNDASEHSKLEMMSIAPLLSVPLLLCIAAGRSPVKHSLLSSELNVLSILKKLFFYKP